MWSAIWSILKTSRFPDWGNAELVTMSEIRIRAIAFKDSGFWCVQCLEYDIAAQAETIPDLRKELARVLLAYVLTSAELKREHPFAGLPPAPRRFFEMYDSIESSKEDEILPMLGSSPTIVPRMRVAQFIHSH